VLEPPEQLLTAFTMLVGLMCVLQIAQAILLVYVCTLLRGVKEYAADAIDAAVLGREPPRERLK